MVAAWSLWTYLGLQRLWELSRARHNARELLARGAVEYGAGHYLPMVAFHAAFFALLAWKIAAGAELSGRAASWLALFAAAQALRFASIRELGPFWTTRIIRLPGGALARGGPYRWLRHPIYVAVAAEILAVPMAYGLPGWALALSAINAALLLTRIREENRALAV